MSVASTRANSHPASAGPLEANKEAAAAPPPRGAWPTAPVARTPAPPRMHTRSQHAHARGLAAPLRGAGSEPAHGTPLPSVPRGALTGRAEEEGEARRPDVGGAAVRRTRTHAHGRTLARPRGPVRGALDVRQGGGLPGAEAR